MRREGCAQGTVGRLAGRGAAIVVACAACTGEPATRWLVVDEELEFCASAPYSTVLVPDTHWKLTILAGEIELPAATSLAEPGSLRGAETSPIDLTIEITDIAGAKWAAETGLPAAVFKDRDVDLTANEHRDVLFVEQPIHPFPETDDAWGLDLLLETSTGFEFSFGSDTSGSDTDIRWMRAGGQYGGYRVFEACDPGGATTRTRVTFDRGEALLDVRILPDGVIANGELPHRMFPAAAVRIDDVEVIVDEHSDLLMSSQKYDASEASYAVLAEAELGAAGLGCGVVFEHLGTESQRAFTVDCGLQELEPLEIVAVTRELLP